MGVGVLGGIGVRVGVLAETGGRVWAQVDDGIWVEVFVGRVGVGCHLGEGGCVKMEPKVDFGVEVSSAVGAGTGSIVVGSIGRAVGGAVGVGDGVAEDVEAGMGLHDGMGVGDVEVDVLRWGRGVQDGAEVGGLDSAGIWVGVGMGVLVDCAGEEQVTPGQSSGMLLPTSRQQQAQSAEHETTSTVYCPGSS